MGAIFWNCGNVAQPLEGMRYDRMPPLKPSRIVANAAALTALAPTRRANYACGMARFLLIAVLLIQPLAAQAAMAGMTCMHASAGQSAGHSMAMHHMDQHASHRGAPDTVRSNCDCHCAIAGHCSVSMMGVLARATAIEAPLRGIGPNSATDAATTGYGTPPYRPPSLPAA